MTDRAMLYQKYLYCGFSFPESFINHVSKSELDDIEPWWLFCTPSNYVDFWCEKVRELYPERKLIPFANWRYSNDIVCFDGEDESGNPKVYHVHAFAASGWEGRGQIDSFTEWLNMASIESTRIKEERTEEDS